MYRDTRPCKSTGSTSTIPKSISPPLQARKRRQGLVRTSGFYTYVPISASVNKKYQTRVRGKRGLESAFASSFRNPYKVSLCYPRIREQWWSRMEQNRQYSRDPHSWSLKSPKSSASSSSAISPSKKSIRLSSHPKFWSQLNNRGSRNSDLSYIDQSSQNNHYETQDAETPPKSKETSRTSVFNGITSAFKNAFNNSAAFDRGKEAVSSSSVSGPDPSSSHSSLFSTAVNRRPESTPTPLQPPIPTPSELLQSVLSQDMSDEELSSFNRAPPSDHAEYTSTPIKGLPLSKSNIRKSNSNDSLSFYLCSPPLTPSRSPQSIYSDTNTGYGSSFKFNSQKKSPQNSTGQLNPESEYKPETKSRSSSPKKLSKKAKKLSSQFVGELKNDKVLNRLKKRLTGNSTVTETVVPDSPYPPANSIHDIDKELNRLSNPNTYLNTGFKKSHRRIITNDITIEEYREILNRREQEVARANSTASISKITQSSSSLLNEKRLANEKLRHTNHEYYELTAKRKEMEESIKALKLDDKKEKEKESKAKQLDEPVKALESAHLEKVKRVWKQPGTTSTLAETNRIVINSRDLSSLMDNTWLNDNVINFYLALVTQRSQDNTDLPRCFSFNTFFYSNLSTKGYSSVARWASRKKINVTKLDYLFIPINSHGAHWSFAMVDLIQKQFLYVDSMATRPNAIGDKALELLKYYMIQESSSQDSSPNSLQKWTEFYDAYEVIGADFCPQQNNGVDCGVFTCKAIEVRSRGKEANYSQKDMLKLRRKMVYEILECKLLT